MIQDIDVNAVQKDCSPKSLYRRITHESKIKTPWMVKPILNMFEMPWMETSVFIKTSFHVY